MRLFPMPDPRPASEDLLAQRLAQSRGLTRADLSIAAAATKVGRRAAMRPVAQLAEVADRNSLLVIAAAVGAGRAGAT